MNLFIKKILNLIKALIKVILIVALIFVGYLYFDKIFEYVVHSQSFYLVHLGDNEYKKENYQEAIDYYRRALELHPKHIKARYNLGNIYVAYEDFPSAVQEYKTVLKHEPDYLNARISLGIVLAEELFEFDQAIEHYEKVIKTGNNFITIPFLYDNREHIIKSKAIAYYNMGLAYRDKSLLYLSKSTAYRQLLLKAAESYEKSLELISNNYDAQYNFALTVHLLGLYTDALTGYCKAMLIAPLNYEAHFNLAVLLKQRSMYRESFEEFRDAGSLMVYNGDSFHAAKIYGMLDEVSKMAIAEYGYKPKKVIERIDDEMSNMAPGPDSAVTVHELEEAIRKRIKTASICRNYLKGE